MVLVLAGGLGASTPLRAALGWPLAPYDGRHHVLSVIEYMDRSSSDLYFHRGLDVFGSSVDDPSPSWAIAVQAGRVKDLECEPSAYPGLTIGCLAPSGNGCWVTVAKDTTDHVYGHLACDGYDPAFIEKVQNTVEVAEGDRIAPLRRWTEDCAGVFPTHLHFEVIDQSVGRLVAPSTVIPFYGEDEDPPTITGLEFAGDDASLPTSTPWSLFEEPAVAGTCREVSGSVDLIVGHESRHRGGAAARAGDDLGVRQVRWRACGGADPDCAWRPAIDWSTVDAAWIESEDYVRAAHSVRDPLVSDDDWICGDNVFHSIPTNVVDAGNAPRPDRTGAWNPPSGPMESADKEHFTVTAEVEDFAGRSATILETVCSRPKAAGGVAKLLIRDCEGDDGAEPSSPSRCDEWSESPDLLVDDRGAALPLAYDVTACMRNVGNAAISGLEKVTLTITTRSSATGGAISHLSEFVVAAMKHRGGGAFSTSDWSPGEERCATAVLLAPGGGSWWTHDVLEATVERAGDAANGHASIAYDNNRAQRSVDFTGRPVVEVRRTDLRLPGEPPGAAAAEAKTVLLERLDRCRRDVSRPRVPEPSCGPRATLQVLVGPGVTFSTPEGGVVIGAMAPRSLEAWDAARPLAPGDPGLELAGGDGARRDLGAASALWRVIEIVPGADALRFTTPSLDGRAPMKIVAWRETPGAADGPPPCLIRVSSPLRPGGPAVEWFQRRVVPAEGGGRPSTR